MIPAERLQNWATHILPSDLGVAVLATGVVVALLSGLLRARANLLNSLPGLVYLALAAGGVRAWAQLSDGATWALTGSTAVALWLHFRFFPRPPSSGSAAPAHCGPMGRADYAPAIEDPFRTPAVAAPAAAAPQPPAPPALGARLFLLIAAGVCALLLFDDLNDYAGTLIGWESPVVRSGFVSVFETGEGFGAFLRERLLWDDGVLSAGHTSLFYGAPTYLLLERLGATPAVLRLAAVAATLLSIAVLYWFVRRHFGRSAATAAAAFYALSTPVIFYGRYGSSIAGTLLAALLAFAGAWHFLERGRWILLRAFACAVLLYVATLQYSPARLLVVFLLAAVPLTLFVEFRRTRWSHWLGVVLIGAIAWNVWSFEAKNNRQHFFLHARGEHVLGFFRNPDTIAALVGTEHRYERGELTRDQKLEVLRLVVAKTMRELVKLFSPEREPRIRGAVVIFDPPPMTMYFAPLAVIILFGLAGSLAGWRSWRHGHLVLFSLSFAAVLLFTNRVDPHRAALLLIPMAIWFGLGAAEIGRLTHHLRLPGAILWVLALSLAAAACFSDISIRYGGVPRLPRVIEIFGEEIDAARGPVSLWVARDHRELSWLALRILDKSLRTGEPAGSVLAPALSDGLRQDRGGPTGMSIRQATRLARQGTLILGPPAMFIEAAQRLRAQGLRVADRNAAGYAYYRIDGGAQRTGISDDELMPAALPPPRPTPAMQALSPGRKVYLSDLSPEIVEHGFAAPRMDTTWQGAPVVMGGVPYEKAIGTHAWTQLRFAVPDDAFLFQAVVGLTDDIRACEAATVEFELRGDRDQLLWKSPVVDQLTPPLPVEILIAGQRHVTLITTDAGNDRDCDHGNWGKPAFVMRDETVPTPASGG